MATMTLHDIIDTSDGDVFSTHHSLDRAQEALTKTRERYPSLDISIRSHTVEDIEPKVAALALHLAVSPKAIGELRSSDDTYECDGEPGQWRVLTDEEASEAFSDSMHDYVNECVLGQIPERYRDYFAEDVFIHDVERFDGRGPQLALYDGNEREEQTDGEWYFIYRVG